MYEVEVVRRAAQGRSAPFARPVGMESNLPGLFTYHPVSVAGTLLSASDLGGGAREDAQPEAEPERERPRLAFLRPRARRYPTAASPSNDFTSA